MVQVIFQLTDVRMSKDFKKTKMNQKSFEEQARVYGGLSLEINSVLTFGCTIFRNPATAWLGFLVVYIFSSSANIFLLACEWQQANIERVLLV